MDFNIGMKIGNINDYMRQQSLQSKYNSGKTDKILQAEKREQQRTKSSENTEEKPKTEEEKMIESITKYMEEYNSSESQDKQRFGIVIAKLNGSGSVSASDMQFLKRYSPEMYQKLCKAKSAKEAIAKKLKRCKTKRQVMHLRTNVTQAAIIPNSAGNRYSPNTTVSDMMTTSGIESYKYHAMSSEWNQFVRSKAYQKLPQKLKKSLKHINKSV